MSLPECWLTHTFTAGRPGALLGAIALLLLLGTLSACGAKDRETQDFSARPANDQAAAESCDLDPPTERVMCTQQYDPVCGCDGKTYGNACTAGAAGVPRHTPGACADRLD